LRRGNSGSDKGPRIGDAQAALNIRAHARFSEGVFVACPKLKIVSVWGTGTDNIDLNAAGMRGVTVCNTPGINAFAVAEHALTLMLTVGRRIVTLDAEMRAEYDKFKAQSSGTEYRARHILVENEDDAKKLITQIKGGAKFDEPKAPAAAASAAK